MPDLLGDPVAGDEPVIIMKPWGHEVIWARVTGRYVGKFLHVQEGEQLSLQYHHRKDETLTLISGNVVVFLDRGQGSQAYRLEPGVGLRVKPGVIHRVVAVSNSVICEVSTDDLWDVVRLEDTYAREGTRDP